MAINLPNAGAEEAHKPAIVPTTPLTGLVGDGHSEEQLQTLMGLSLLLGFIFMLFVDQVGGWSHTHSPPPGRQLIYIILLHCSVWSVLQDVLYNCIECTLGRFTFNVNFHKSEKNSDVFMIFVWVGVDAKKFRPCPLN